MLRRRYRARPTKPEPRSRRPTPGPRAQDPPPSFIERPYSLFPSSYSPPSSFLCALCGPCARQILMLLFRARSLCSLKHAKDAKRFKTDIPGFQTFNPKQDYPGFLCALCGLCARPVLKIVHQPDNTIDHFLFTKIQHITKFQIGQF